jgi:hypothetical protein
MSTSSGTRSRPTQTARQTLKQRGVEATQRLRDRLNLATDLGDSAILGTALAEVAAREIARNPQFGREVRQLYDELMQMQARPAPRTTNLEPLEAIRHTGKNIDPYGPPNPQDLIYAYGEDKLGRALQDYTMDRLKMAVETIQREHPGTKPASKAKKSALIEYIVQYSTNGR